MKIDQVNPFLVNKFVYIHPEKTIYKHLKKETNKSLVWITMNK